MMKTLDEQFQTIPDNRTGNAAQYQSPDVLKAASAMFSLKPPSLLDFNTQATAEEKRVCHTCLKENRASRLLFNELSKSSLWAFKTFSSRQMIL